MRSNSILRGLAAWLLTAVIQLLAAVLLSMTEWFSPTLSGVCLWGVYPLVGALTACWATLHGVNNYLAWISAPAMLTLGYWLVWSYLPAAGQMLLSALLALIGAATGETKKQFDRRKQK